MEKLIANFLNYNIWQGDESTIYELAKFVVSENYHHHNHNQLTSVIEKEILEIYEEELEYFQYSSVFVAREPEGKIIGCIRLLKWDKVKKLPIQKIFGLDPLKNIKSSSDATFWHIGRLAVNNRCDISSLSLFKQLIIYAIKPIYYQNNSIMVAEYDNKLLRILRLLGIRITEMGESINYLGSLTTPAYSNNDDLEYFYHQYKHLYKDSYSTLLKSDVDFVSEKYIHNVMDNMRKAV